MNHTLIGCAVLACSSLAQVPISPPTVDRVVHDAPGDGHLWACGTDWKASFGIEGLTYYPYVPGAQRNWPVGFRIAGVRVGGVPVAYAAHAAPRRDGDRVWFDRGAVREVYDLRLREVEQTFVVDTRLAGDVEIDLAVDSQLREDSTLPGLQFGGADGALHYGEAFLVRDAEKLAIESSWDGNAIRLRVPAAVRGDGPVVIDPILTTESSSASGAIYQPDVAWDEANQRYLVVWEKEFSATDHDILTELFDADGAVIPHSVAAVDTSGTDWMRPRVANLRTTQRFLVAAEVADPNRGGRHMIYFRTRDAGGLTAVHGPVLLSDANFPGNNFAPSVGADPGIGSGPHRWLIAWTNDGDGDYNAVARLVDEFDQPALNVLFIADSAHQLNANVQISRSNGNGIVPTPRWFAVYSRHDQGGGWNIYGRTIDPGGVMGSEVPLDTAAGDDLYPRASSPILTADGRTQFLITYEHQSPAEARAVVATLSPIANTYIRKNLTAEFGLDPFWVRAESDGARYAVTAGTATSIRVRTFAATGSTLLLHDGPHPLVGDGASLPEIAARRSSGGAAGEYGIGIVAPQGGSSRAWLVRYAGQTSGATRTVLPTACDGLQIDVSGASVVGGSLQFALSNFGSGLPGFAFGSLDTAPLPICPTCSLGLRTDRPIVGVVGSPVLRLAIPSVVRIVGGTFAIQGIAVGPGTCFGALAFSDTLGFTIR